MAEKEYIEREALKRDLIDNRGFYPSIVKSAIENAPTADVVEVVHGFWATLRSGCDCVCSMCGRYWIDVADKYDFNYCPNCGAKMDGRDGEGK